MSALGLGCVKTPRRKRRHVGISGEAPCAVVFPRALATLRRLHTEGASEYVQYHAAATWLDRAGYGQLDQPVQQQALIVNINLGPTSPPVDDMVLGPILALPKGPICGPADDEGDQSGGGW
jgi:hypothetical protein